MNAKIICLRRPDKSAKAVCRLVRGAGRLPSEDGNDESSRPSGQVFCPDTELSGEKAKSARSGLSLRALARRLT